MKKTYEGILFDLDGTLIDTSEGVKHAVALTHKEMNLKVPDDKILKRFVGPPMQDSFIREYGFSKEEAQYAADTFRRNYVNNSLFIAQVYPNVIETLDYLKQKQYSIGVATYKREDYAIDILKHFKIFDYCDVMHGGDNNNIRKKEDIVNMCIEELKISMKDRIVLIGDSEYDAIGAERAGVNFFGVLYGFGFKELDYKDKYKAIGWGVDISDIRNYF